MVGLWGGWQYQISKQDTSLHSLQFSHGGYQEARGSGIKDNHYFVENIFEELDSPGEWFYDPVSMKLFVWPNRTDGGVGESIVAPLLSTIVRVQDAYDVTFSGIKFTETRATFLDQYEIPSGGDWALHRGGAFEIWDSSNVTVHGCLFDQIGGNGVLVSNNVKHSSILFNEFVYVGDSAIVVTGSTNGILGVEETYPDGNLFANNHIHEFGVYGKQTSCYFQSRGANNIVRDNLCYNGPRAGINWNDGFAGGNLVKGNLIFNQVRVACAIFHTLLSFFKLHAHKRAMT